MRLAFAPILLFMAGCLFQAANPQTSSTQTEKAAQPDSKLKTIWELGGVHSVCGLRKRYSGAER